MDLSFDLFSDIDLADPFFDSLKEDYEEFSDWFRRKANERAYVMRDEDGNLCAFLYLKVEFESLDDVVPPLPASRRLKVGTLKINAHGTRLGERFIKKIFDHALATGITEIYVTVFEKHSGLLRLLERYGFLECGKKESQNGSELVLIKDLNEIHEDLVASYPTIDARNVRAYLLAIYPVWHSRLLPDSILVNEDASIVQDVSHSNSIHKVYLAAMRDLPVVRKGDILMIYRTGDNAGPAEHRSVVTSLCVVEEYRNINSFDFEEDFINYCAPYSVFETKELQDFWSRKKYPHIIRFTYNLAFPKRINRKTLIEEHGLAREGYWGFLEVTMDQVRSIVQAAKADESIVVY